MGTLLSVVQDFLTISSRSAGSKITAFFSTAPDWPLILHSALNYVFDLQQG